MKRLLLLVTLVSYVSLSGMEQFVVWVIEKNYVDVLIALLRVHVVPKNIFLKSFEHAAQASTEMQNALLLYGSDPLENGRGMLWGKPCSYYSGLFEFNDILFSFWKKKNSAMFDDLEVKESVLKLASIYCDAEEPQYNHDGARVALYSCLWCAINHQHELAFGPLYHMLRYIGKTQDFKDTITYYEDAATYANFSQKHNFQYAFVERKKMRELHNVTFRFE